METDGTDKFWNVLAFMRYVKWRVSLQNSINSICTNIEIWLGKRLFSIASKLQTIVSETS